ncbi:MAG: hypothetical protein ACRCUT_09310, partial [Spirochaetota bacterium]
KVTMPSYIKSGSGRVDDAVFVTRRGRAYMMSYKAHADAGTESQRQIRRSFASVVSDWKMLKGAVRNAWEISAKGDVQTGYNAFIGTNVPLRRGGELIDLCCGSGEDSLTHFTAVPGNASGSLQCAFDPIAEGKHLTVFLRKLTADQTTSPVTRRDLGAAPASPVTLDALDSGADYEVYALVCNAPYAEAAAVSESVAAKVKVN